MAVRDHLASLEQYELTEDDAHRVTTFKDLLSGSLDFEPSEIYIDDADCLLALIVRKVAAGIRLAGFSMSNTVHERLDITSPDK